MSESTRFRVGYRIAQAGAAFHVVGGLGDQAIRALLPPHVEVLGAVAAAEPGTSRLVLALLHVLGSALAATGIALLVLLHLWRRDRSRWVAVAICAVTVLAEGVNGVGILSLGNAIGLVPIGFAALVVLGVGIAATSPKEAS